jgi:hypothetical protein
MLPEHPSPAPPHPAASLFLTPMEPVGIAKSGRGEGDKISAVPRRISLPCIFFFDCEMAGGVARARARAESGRVSGVKTPKKLRATEFSTMAGRPRKPTQLHVIDLREHRGRDDPTRRAVLLRVDRHGLVRFHPDREPADRDQHLRQHLRHDAGRVHGRAVLAGADRLRRRLWRPAIASELQRDCRRDVLHTGWIVPRPCCTDRCGWRWRAPSAPSSLDKASGVAHKDRAGVGRDRDHDHRRRALALAVGEATAWASGPAPARQAP